MTSQVNARPNPEAKNAEDEEALTLKPNSNNHATLDPPETAVQVGVQKEQQHDNTVLFDT